MSRTGEWSWRQNPRLALFFRAEESWGWMGKKDPLEVTMAKLTRRRDTSWSKKPHMFRDVTCMPVRVFTCKNMVPQNQWQKTELESFSRAVDCLGLWAKKNEVRGKEFAQRCHWGSDTGESFKKTGSMCS